MVAFTRAVGGNVRAHFSLETSFTSSTKRPWASSLRARKDGLFPRVQQHLGRNDLQLGGRTGLGPFAGSGLTLAARDCSPPCQRRTASWRSAGKSCRCKPPVSRSSAHRVRCAKGVSAAVPLVLQNVESALAPRHRSSALTLPAGIIEDRGVNLAVGEQRTGVALFDAELESTKKPCRCSRRPPPGSPFSLVT
jgi:hypothetical protein